MIIAFTGPTLLTRKQELIVARRMDVLVSDPDTWRSGCADGVDTIAARHAVMAGVLRVELYVPAAYHNTKLVAELDGIATIIRCPAGPEPYRIRNKMMIGSNDKADLLVAFVKSDKFYRSGEWMTINIARKRDVLVEKCLV